MLSQRFRGMPRGAKIGVIAAALMALTAFGYWLPNRLQLSAASERTPSAEQSLLNLGFDYMPVTPEVARANRLRNASGVLVTRVAPGSPAERAGLKAGDVVASFDGVVLDSGTSLLEMLIACPGGGTLNLEVYGEDESRAIRVVTARTQ